MVRHGKIPAMAPRQDGIGGGDPEAATVPGDNGVASAFRSRGCDDGGTWDQRWASWAQTWPQSKTDVAMAANGFMSTPATRVRGQAMRAILCTLFIVLR